MQAIRERACRDAENYVNGGADALIIENTHDIPYQRSTVDASTISGMSVIARDLVDRFSVPIGIQLLAGADLEAIDVAVSCGLSFIRSEGFVYAHVADEGIIEGNAAVLLRRRAHLDARHVQIWADVKKKHCAHALTGDLDVKEFALGAAYCAADAVIVTGARTGLPPDPADIEAAGQADLPVYIGSGIDDANITQLGPKSGGLIVGSACKIDGDWRNEVDLHRVRRLTSLLSGQQGG
jgi:membrane complex biogenesis BtpA family protein